METLTDPLFVEFLESSRPSLKAGLYRVRIHHDTQGPGIAESTQRDFTFTVAGPRFSLDPQDIASVFPPPGSPGDHQNAFPHIALVRSTLPWERSADTDAIDDETEWHRAAAPWLALLQYDDEDERAGDIRVPPELQNGGTLTLGTLGKARDAAFPAFQTDLPLTTPVSAVDVKTDRLAAFLPSATGVRLLCHTRRNILLSVPKTGNLTLEALPAGTLQSLGIAPEDAPRLTATDLQHCSRLTTASGPRSFLVWENIPGPGDTGAGNGVAGPSWLFTDALGAEYAFVTGHRLPRPGKTTTVHLVSLEGRFTKGQLNDASGKQAYCRFVSLHQWRFTCESHDHTFEQLLLNLNRSPDPTDPATTDSAALRLPPAGDGTAEAELSAGLTLQPHQFRNGSRSFSWYRGPLTTGARVTENPLPLPAESPDALLAYDPRTGLFHAGYAAAWELGRMLCLGNSRVSQALHAWKTRHRRQLRQQNAGPLLFDQLGLSPPATSGTGANGGTALPEVVAEWVAALRRLEPVPFRYLVPDERMLPVESIRFFQVDPLWLDCAVDGAFSIGRSHGPADGQSASAGDQSDRPDQSDQSDLKNPPPPAPVSGLLLRSAAVSGWPLLQMTARSGGTPASPLKTIRFERLTPDILLCLFDSVPGSIEIFLPRETLHFGLPPDGTSGKNPPAGFPPFDSATRRLVFAGPPATGSYAVNPATFAHHLLQPAPKVIFASG